MVGLPSLEYDLASRKLSIGISAFAILFGCFGLQLLLFEVLYNCTSLELQVVLSICSIGPSVSLPQWPLRMYYLLRTKDHRRARGSPRWALDLYQWEFTIGIAIVSVFVALGCALPSVNLFLMAPPVLVAQTAVQCLLSVGFYLAGIRTPFTMGTQKKGTPARPAAFYIVSDVVGCDGGGGQDYRDRLEARYNASPMFQKLLATSTLIASVVSLLYFALECVLIFAIDYSYSAKFAASMGLTMVFPLALGGLLFFYVRRGLREEWEWNDQHDETKQASY